MNMSSGSFFIGLLTGMIIASVLVGGGFLYLSNGRTVMPTSDAALDRARTLIAEERTKNSNVVHGEVVSIGNGDMVIQALVGAQREAVEFRFDTNSKFYTLSNDEEVAEVPLQASDINVGDRVTVTADKKIGNTSGKYAQEILRL